VDAHPLLDPDDDPLRGERDDHESDEPLRVLLEGENGEILRQRHVLYERGDVKHPAL
jgi:hypothetical protein